MKKLFTMILAFALLFQTVALADTLPNEEGIQLQSGVWKVGKHIPAGDWTIEPFSVDPYSHDVYILYCDVLDEARMNGNAYDSKIWSDQFLTFETFQPENMYPTFLNIHLEEGRYIIIKYGILTFKPYIEDETSEPQ